MNRWTKRLVTLAAIVAAFVALRLTVLRPAPVPVTVAVVDRGRVESTVVNSKAGTVKSRHRSEMSPGVAGMVAEIPVQKGQRVKQGQVLLRIDDSEYRAQVNLAARSADAAKAAADQACLGAQLSARERRRVEELQAQRAIATQDVDVARTKAETDSAGCVAARARARQAVASLEVAQATLAKCVIVAPFDGVVLDVRTDVGEWITPSPPGVVIPPVIDVIDPASLYVEAPIDEADAAKVSLDQPARITLDAFRGRSFPGRITYISSFVETAQQQNRTLTIEVEFTQGNLPPNLLPGLSADVEIILDAHDGVVRIPSYAVLEGSHVLVVRGDKLVSVPISVGLSNWQWTEVAAGLRPSEQVVVSLDKTQVKAGARVRVAGEQKP